MLYHVNLGVLINMIGNYRIFLLIETESSSGRQMNLFLQDAHAFKFLNFVVGKTAK